MADVYDINDLNKRLIRQLRGCSIWTKMDGVNIDVERYCSWQHDQRSHFTFVMTSYFVLSPAELFNAVVKVLKMSPISTKVPKGKADGELEASHAGPFVFIGLKAQNKTRSRFNVSDSTGNGWRCLGSCVDSLETELEVNHSVGVLVSGGIKCCAPNQLTIVKTTGYKPTFSTINHR